MLALVFAALLPILPAEQASQAASAPNAVQPGPLLPARSLSQLFSLTAPPNPDGRTTGVADARRASPKTKVVCGMTVIIVDGSIDPKMAISPKPDGGEFTIRRMPKPMCGEK